MIEAEKIRELINVNLELIHNAKNQSLYKSNFVDLEKKKLDNPDELIGIMVKLDLIETESDDDIYFLTEIGYDWAENGWHWTDLLSLRTSVVDEEDFEGDYDPNPIPLIYNQSKGKKYIWYLLAFIIVTYYLLMNNRKSDTSDFKISPELIEQLQLVSDSLRNSNPQDTLRLEVRDSTIR